MIKMLIGPLALGLYAFSALQPAQAVGRTMPVVEPPQRDGANVVLTQGPGAGYGCYGAHTGWGYGMGRGMHGGMHHGMGHGMGHGMHHGWGSGMYGGYGMRPGWGYGMYGGYGMQPGWGYGMYGGYGTQPGYAMQYGAANLDLSVDDVRDMMERELAAIGNKRLKVGNVTEKDDTTVIAEIVTVDDSLVQRFEVDRRSGWKREIE